jgi:hypothetical protein
MLLEEDWFLDSKSVNIQRRVYMVILMCLSQFISAQTDILTQTNYISESTINSAATLLLGKNFENGSSSMLRFQAEKLWIQNNEGAYQCQAVSNNIGYQFPIQSEKHKLAIMACPKWTGSSNGLASISEWQMGGLALLTVQENPNFMWRVGLFVNKEFFGYMIVPLLGFDWKTKNHWRLYGLAPNSMRFGKYSKNEKWNTGIYGRSFTRSFRAVDNNHFIRYNEVHLGVFTERTFGKHHAVQFYMAEQLGKSPRYYSASDKSAEISLPGLSLKRNYVICGFGYSFRI